MAIIYLRKQVMNNNVDNTGGNKDLAENGIVVTEAMIEAGVLYLNEVASVGSEALVEGIFRAMILEGLDNDCHHATLVRTLPAP